jgi:hypothetical protein
VCVGYGDGIDQSKIDVFGVINENEMLKQIYFRKSIDWIGENEYRWLIFDESGKDVFVSIKSAVKEVVLGSKFPTNHISQARRYCEELGCPCYKLEYQHPKYELTLTGL